MQWFRAFLPSWQFYRDVGPYFELQVQNEKGEWQRMLPELRRNPISLVLNPRTLFRYQVQYKLQELARWIEGLNPDNPVSLNSADIILQMERLIKLILKSREEKMELSLSDLKKVESKSATWRVIETSLGSDDILIQKDMQF